MARPSHICDVFHCGQSRRPQDRLCIRCDTRLPAHLRVAIASANDERRLKDWVAARREAADYLNLAPRPALPVGIAAPVPPAPYPRVSSQRAFELQARMLGERADV